MHCLHFHLAALYPMKSWDVLKLKMDVNSIPVYTDEELEMAEKEVMAIEKEIKKTRRMI